QNFVRPNSGQIIVNAVNAFWYLFRPFEPRNDGAAALKLFSQELPRQLNPFFLPHVDVEKNQDSPGLPRYKIEIRQRPFDIHALTVAARLLPNLCAPGIDAGQARRQEIWPLGRFPEPMPRKPVKR